MLGAIESCSNTEPGKCTQVACHAYDQCIPYVPPNTYMESRAGMYTAAWRQRAKGVGPAAGFLVHSCVWTSRMYKSLSVPASLIPPNTTIHPRSGISVALCPCRGEGRSPLSFTSRHRTCVVSLGIAVTRWAQPELAVYYLNMRLCHFPAPPLGGIPSHVSRLDNGTHLRCEEKAGHTTTWQQQCSRKQAMRFTTVGLRLGVEQTRGRRGPTEGTNGG